MLTIDQTRRDNLKLLAEQAGSVQSLANALGKSSSQVSQWLNASRDSKTGKPRAIANSTAREIEEKCNLPVGWLDTDHRTSYPEANADDRYDKKHALTTAFKAMCAGLDISELQGLEWIEDEIFGLASSSDSLNIAMEEPYPGAKEEAQRLFGASSPISKKQKKSA